VTLASLLGSIALLVSFVALEARSRWPLLPLRLFRHQTLAASNAAMAIIGAVTFSEFFLLTLYVQDVLGYSAVKSGAAFVGFAGTVVVVSNLAQAVVGRLGVRTTLSTGFLLSAASVAWLTRLPVDGHYFSDLFPAFVVGGAGMALSFVPLTIAGLAGVDRSDAGVASGLINTSRQIGGAIGIAVASAIAAAATTGHGIDAVDHGFRIALVALLGLLLVGVGVTAVFVRPDRAGATRELPAAEPALLKEAA
jgi:predicted MFS family arabinose efflux permease